MKKLLFLFGFLMMFSLSSCSKEYRECAQLCEEMSETECLEILDVKVSSSIHTDIIYLYNAPPMFVENTDYTSEIELSNGEKITLDEKVSPNQRIRKTSVYYPNKIVEGDSVRYEPQFQGYRYTPL